MEVLDACPWCDGRRLAAWRRGRDRQHRLSEEWFDYSRCRECGLLFLSTRPLEQDIGAFYPHDYGPYHAPFDMDSSASPNQRTGRPRRSWLTSASIQLLRRINSTFLRPDPVASRLAAAYHPARSGARLLDFGCGSSEFLDRARDDGWETIGMDFSDEVLERVREAGHVALSTSAESWRELADGSLDFVRLHHVLEHLYRPREVLSEVARVLAPGAWVHIGLPNPVGISSRLFRSCWFGLECPRHILLYRPSFVADMLRAYGFRDVSIVGDPVTKDFVRSWAYVRQKLGVRGSEDVASALRGPLVVGLEIPMRGLAKIGLADRFHVLARRAGDPS